MRAVGKHVICQVLEDKYETASGMELTSASKSEFRYKKGKVLSVGEETQNVFVDEVIYFDAARGIEMLMEGKLVMAILHQSIVGVEEELTEG